MDLESILRMVEGYQHWWDIYTVPGTLLMLLFFRYYFLHFIDKALEARKVTNVPNVMPFIIETMDVWFKDSNCFNNDLVSVCW